MGLLIMRWTLKTYDVSIERNLDPAELLELSYQEAEEAAESGYLAGNQMYIDLRGFSWADVGTAITIEQRILDRLVSAKDLEQALAVWEEDRFSAQEPEDELWGLDVGVAAATIALSALGAAPVGSCNAGGFGGQHQARYPYIAFLGPRSAVPDITHAAELAEVGLVVGGDGLGRLVGATDLDLIRFARSALMRSSRTR